MESLENKKQKKIWTKRITRYNNKIDGLLHKILIVDKNK
jgi:hypothetical protein